MMVSDLKKLLQDIGTLLENQGAKQRTADIERIATCLDRYSDRTISELCEVQIAGADDSVNERRSDRPRTRPLDHERVREAIDAFRSLYDRAITPDLSFEAITQEIERLEKYLIKEEALEVAKEFGVSGSVKSKIGALQEVGRKIADRKTIHDRTNQIGTPA